VIEDGTPPTDTSGAAPTSARAYGWLLGGKDNYEVDRRFVKGQLEAFPAGLDITRQNRLFLYRAVRYLTVEAGIRQFIDMGCGLPTDANVHQVAQALAPDARVVYVDIDPVVLTYGRALLADNPATAVITADICDQEGLLANPDLRRLIDFDRPVAALFLSVGHHLPDRFAPRRVLNAVMDLAPAGSHVTFSQVVCEDPAEGALMTESVTAAGISWQTRTPAEVDELLSDLDPVDPGLVDLARWRPLELQPPLPPVPAEIAQYEGASKLSPKVYEYGGVLRKR
jgi:hypothetical protein